MAWKSVGLVTAGVVAGIFVAKFVHGGSNSRPPEGLPESPSVQIPAVASVASLTETDPRLTRLRIEIESLKKASVEPRSAASILNNPGKPPTSLTTEEKRQVFAEVVAGMEAASKTAAARRTLEREQHEAELLVAAGFTKERAEWLQRSAKELRAKYDQEVADARRQGRPIDRRLAPAVSDFAVDKEAILRTEISDQEYEKYRRAVGRSTGVEVAGVQSGSNAERAGVKPGDELISYGGKRVFDIVELNKLSMDSPPAGSVPVEVRREGRTLRLWMPSGPAYVKTKAPLPGY